jgi:hypothetical protein
VTGVGEEVVVVGKRDRVKDMRRDSDGELECRSSLEQQRRFTRHPDRAYFFYTDKSRQTCGCLVVERIVEIFFERRPGTGRDHDFHSAAACLSQCRVSEKAHE